MQKMSVPSNPAVKSQKSKPTKSSVGVQKKDELSTNNATWVEQVKKEMKNQKLNETFTVNTRNMHILTGKPTAITSPLATHSLPVTATDAEKADHQKDVQINESLHELFKHANQTPVEKYEFPMTQAQEIGWFSSEMRSQPQWNQYRSSCVETKYASAYVADQGKSPFCNVSTPAKPSRAAKPKAAK